MNVETSPALRDALSLYAHIQQQLVAVGRQADPSRRMELVRWRRRLAEQTGKVGTLIEQDPLLARNPHKQREMSQLFSTFRYAFGHHQAKWPVVKAAGDIVEYVESARDTYGKGDLFWAWCADNLEFSSPH